MHRWYQNPQPVQSGGNAHALKEMLNPIPKPNAQRPFFKLIITLALNILVKDGRKTRCSESRPITATTSKRHKLFNKLKAMLSQKVCAVEKIINLLCHMHMSRK
jgi:thymidine phosphorylase